MKSSWNILVVIGALAAAAVGGWYMYMQGTPQYDKAAQRGLDPALFPPPADGTTAPSALVAPSSAPAAPTSAPAAPTSAPAAPTSGP